MFLASTEAQKNSLGVCHFGNNLDVPPTSLEREYKLKNIRAYNSLVT